MLLPQSDWSLLVVTDFSSTMESLSSFHGGQDSHVLQVGNKLLLKGRRRKREFIPKERKDALYWEKRHKNNEAAKRSREKKKMNDFALETHLMALKEENARLSAELLAIKLHFGLVHAATYTDHQSSQLQQRVHGCMLPVSAPSTQHQSLQKDYYWGNRHSSLMSSQQVSQPLLVPTYALHTMTGYSYLNTSSNPTPGLLSPLVVPRNLLPTQSYRPAASPLKPTQSYRQAASPLKPIPKRATSDEKEEQQVPGVLSLSCAAPPRRITAKRDRDYSPPRQYMFS
uniref:nuclear factor interleukin-3-regulated protein-like isoform X2 n=1 Tax=Monopterus albus TaxID=43700 RepID=UPI0009B483CF|nr:nuclear factor interleukin-3-regulated protein-like isoform X2 [Monopterus albus]